MKAVLRGKFIAQSAFNKEIGEFSYYWFKSTPGMSRKKKKQTHPRGVDGRKYPNLMLKSIRNKEKNTKN